MTVAADTLTSVVGADDSRISFIKVDIEDAETVITPQIAPGFSHPRLVVALEVRTQIEATLKAFEEQGFHICDLHSDYHWLLERKVPAITEATCRDFYHRSLADLLLSGQPLTLS